MTIMLDFNKLLAIMLGMNPHSVVAVDSMVLIPPNHNGCEGMEK